MFGSTRSGSTVNLTAALFAFLVFLFGPGVPGAVYGADTPTRSQLVLTQDTFDFGTVPQGTIVKHDFILSNSGTAPFTIQRIAPSCGCTASTADKDQVGPGEQVPVHVSFDTTGFSGEKLKTIRVFTSDLDRPSVVLTIHGNVLPDVLVQPAQLFFDEVVRGVPSEPKEIVVQVREGSATKITSVQSFSPYVKLQEIEGDPSRKRMAVSIDPQAPRGDLRERVVIGVSGSAESTINIPVFASVKGILRLRPQTVSFGVIEGQEVIEKSIQLDNLGTTPISVLGISSDNPAVAGSVKAVKAGKNFVLTVRVDPSKVQRDLRAVLTVRTDSGEEQTVALNVFGILPPRS